MTFGITFGVNLGHFRMTCCITVGVDLGNFLMTCCITFGVDLDHVLITFGVILEAIVGVEVDHLLEGKPAP